MAESKPGKDFIGVGVGVFINNDQGETLLLRRSNQAKNDVGFWARPGGTIEYGEKAIQALKREVKEEIGIAIKNIESLGFFDHILKEDHQHWLALHFMAEIKSGKPRNMEPDKHDEMRWFKFAEIPAKLAMPTKASLEQMIKLYKEKHH